MTSGGVSKCLVLRNIWLIVTSNVYHFFLRSYCNLNTIRYKHIVTTHRLKKSISLLSIGYNGCMSGVLVALKAYSSLEIPLYKLV